MIEGEDSFCNFDLLESGICWEMFSWGKQQIYHSFLITSFRTIFTLSIHCRVLQLINNVLPLFRKFTVIGILWIVAVITSITTWSVTFFFFFKSCSYMLFCWLRSLNPLDSHISHSDFSNGGLNSEKNYWKIQPYFGLISKLYYSQSHFWHLTPVDDGSGRPNESLNLVKFLTENYCLNWLHQERPAR